MNVPLSKKDKIKVTRPEDVVPIMHRILKREIAIDQDKEHFWIIGMNGVGVILFIELVAMGGGKSVTVEPRKAYRLAVMKDARFVIAVHNHPSKELEPSAADKNMTDRLIKCGDILDVEMRDHLIISPDGFYSFERTGLMDELRKSTKYDLTFLAEERREREIQEIVELEKYKQRVTFFKTLMKAGHSLEESAELAELPIEDARLMVDSE